MIAAVSVAGGLIGTVFDSILQRDPSDEPAGDHSPDSKRSCNGLGIGALAAVVLQPAPRTGLAVLAIILVPTLITFLIGTQLAAMSRRPQRRNHGVSTLDEDVFKTEGSKP